MQDAKLVDISEETERERERERDRQTDRKYMKGKIK